jgi:glutathione S-transferase
VKVIVASWGRIVSPLLATPPGEQLMKIKLVSFLLCPFVQRSVILDFLDESFSPRFHPEDNLKRAQHKAWIEFGSNLLVTQHGMALAQDKDAVVEKRVQLERGLQHLLSPLGQGLFGDPAHFSLVDAAYAPLFMRLDLLARFNPLVKIDYPGPVADWAGRLSSLPCVKASVVDDFPQQFRNHLGNKGAWLVAAGT